MNLTEVTLAAALLHTCAELRELLALLEAASDPRHTAEVIAAVEGAGRLMDAARVRAVTPLARDALAAERLGYASPVAAVAALARVSERTARTRLRLAAVTTPDVSVSGAPLPPRHEHVESALATGELGVEAAALVVRELESVAPRVSEPARRACEGMMVNLACGRDPSGECAPEPVSLDYVTREIRLIGSAVDPDGAEPREDRALRRRAVWLGKQNADGLIPFGGMLQPEIGGLLAGQLEAWRRSPRFESADLADADTLDADTMDADSPSGANDARTHDQRTPDQRTPDQRTPDQRRHDAFAEILMAAAADEHAPRLNGRPVSVLVTVAADELHREGGLDSDPIGVMSGSDFPVSRRQVERFIDAAGYREVVLSPSGAIEGIRSPERCFTGPQASAIAARDGERCFTPGCTSPHTALQVHHVVPWREGGPTTTSNGILLCYWHHRRVDDGPWQYRMVNGMPEVRGPGMPEWHRPGELARIAA